MSAIVALTGPATAQAHPTTPPRPLASFCVQWGFKGDTHISQSDGWGLSFYSKGERAQDDQAVSVNENTLRHGEGATVAGGINGTAVTLKVRWDSGVLRTYEGRVDGNGFASGEFYDDPARRATWRTGDPLKCLDDGRVLEVPPFS